MKQSWHVACAMALLAVSVMAYPAHAANDFPTKPIRIIVPAAPGGGLDITTRMVAQKMGEQLQQSVIIENRSGADTLLGTRFVKDAAADGYTLLAQANGFVALPAIRKDAGYDPIKDFQAVAVMVRAPQLMVVAADHPDATLSEFMTRAKSLPGQLSYGSAGVGGPPHLGAAMFFDHAQLDLLHIPYKGTGAAMPDVASGRVSTLFGSYIASAPYLSASRMRALGVTGSQRLAALPEVPTFQEQGADFTYYYWLGLLAPAGTPQPVVQQLADAVHQAMASQDIQERLRNEGSEAWSIAPESFQQELAKEAQEMGQLMHALNISID